MSTTVTNVTMSDDTLLDDIVAVIRTELDDDCLLKWPLGTQVIDYQYFAYKVTSLSYISNLVSTK